MPTIELPEDTWKRLQKHAIPLVDLPPAVIDRALDALETLQAHQTNSAGVNHGPVSAASPNGADLVSNAGRVPHGTKLRARYKGREYHAEVVDGRLVWNDQRYYSLSHAAVAIIRSTGSPRGTEDGWRFFDYYDETGEDWESLDDFRT